MLGILVVTEGDTEWLFYKALISTHCPRGFAITSYKKLGGIGNFFSQRRKIEKYIRDLLGKVNNQDVIVLLCFDYDVFQPQGGRLQATNPPPNPEELKKRLLTAGASKVFFLTPSNTLEDWIMLDINGVLKHLNLPETTIIKGNTGLAQIERLYKLKGKVYTKNAQDVQKLVEKLDVAYILSALPNNVKKILDKVFSCE